MKNTTKSMPGLLMPGPLMVDVAGLDLTEEDAKVLRHPLVGGAILFSRNFASRAQVARLIRAMRRVRDPLLIAVDYEGGRVQRFRREFTRLPPMRRLGEWVEREPSKARRAAYEIGWLIGAELRAVDVDLCFAPVLDLDAGLSAVIGDRALHNSPGSVTVLGGALVEGMAEAGMCATGKHFPGHGQVAADSHLALPVDCGDYESIRDADMDPFARLIAVGLPSVMMAHILYPRIDATYPASLSSRWIQGRLRGELGFQGAVFCDDLSMNGAAVAGSYSERAERALAAGCDMLPVCNNRSAVRELLKKLKLTPSLASVHRLLKLRGRPPVATWSSLPSQTAWQEAQQAVAHLLASA